LEIRFHKGQVSRLVIKTVKCKRGINLICGTVILFMFCLWLGIFSHNIEK